MDKPKSYEYSKKVINLMDVLDYVDTLVTGKSKSRNRMQFWHLIVDTYPEMQDGHVMHIWWELMLDTIKEKGEDGEDDLKFYETMMREFPEIEADEVDYWVAW